MRTPSRTGGLFSYVHLDSSGADGAKTGCSVQPTNTTLDPNPHVSTLIYGPEKSTSQAIHTPVFQKCQKNITRTKMISTTLTNAHNHKGSTPTQLEA